MMVVSSLTPHKVCQPTQKKIDASDFRISRNNLPQTTCFLTIRVMTPTVIYRDRHGSSCKKVGLEYYIHRRLNVYSTPMPWKGSCETLRQYQYAKRVFQPSRALPRSVAGDSGEWLVLFLLFGCDRWFHDLWSDRSKGRVSTHCLFRRRHPRHRTTLS